MANISEQASVRVTDSSRDEIVSASLTSFQTALQNYPGNKLDAVLIFSCCRRWLLGTRSKEEYELIQNALPYQAPVGGFYTYGELAPLEPQGATSYFHQETFITLLLGIE